MNPLFLNSISVWHICFFIGVYTSYFVFLKQKNSKLNSRFLSGVFILLYVSSYFGARLFSILFETQLSNPFEVLSELLTLGGMTLMGGIIAALLALLGLSLFYKDCFISLVDAVSISFLPGLFWGRVGCFLNGDDYGKPALWLNRYFFKNPRLQDDIPRYPVQLLEASFAIVLFFLISKNKKFFKKDGLVFLTILSSYSFVRFFLEELRGDFRGELYFDHFSLTQLICLCLLAGSCLYLRRLFLTKVP